MNDPKDVPRIQVKVDGEIRDFIPDYLAHRAQEIAILKSALEAKDFARIENLGHRMRGSGLSYGFEGLTEIGSEIEKFAKVKNEEGAQTCIERLEKYLGNLEIIYI